MRLITDKKRVLLYLPKSLYLLIVSNLVLITSYHQLLMWDWLHV